MFCDNMVCDYSKVDDYKLTRVRVKTPDGEKDIYNHLYEFNNKRVKLCDPCHGAIELVKRLSKK